MSAIGENIKAQMQCQSWIKVEDGVPAEGTKVLVYAPKCNVIGPILIGEYYSDDESWTVYGFEETYINEEVTHWMSLPEVP